MRNIDDVLSFEWRSLHQRVWGFPLTTYLPSKRQALYSAYWQYSMQRFIFYLYFTLPTQYKKIGVLPTSGIWSRSNVSNESVRQRETFIVINCLLWTRIIIMWYKWSAYMGKCHPSANSSARQVILTTNLVRRVLSPREKNLGTRLITRLSHINTTVRRKTRQVATSLMQYTE